MLVLCTFVLIGLCFILLVFFFFFKQKTAYEMRISDWSSDVCSSDLTERSIAIALSIVNADLLFSVYRIMFYAGDGNPAMSLVDQIFQKRDFVTPEIGRASCRERVCKYV